MADEPEPTEHKSEPKGAGKGLNGKIGGIPKKYLLIAVMAGLGIGIYLRRKNQAAATTATAAPQPIPTAATDTGTGSSPGGGGFISYPSFVTGGDLAPQPTPAPIMAPQIPQTFTAPVPTASMTPGPTPTVAAAPSPDVAWPTFVGQPVPVGVSPDQALAHYGTLPQANYTTMPPAGGQPVAGLAGEHPFIYG